MTKLFWCNGTPPCQDPTLEELMYPEYMKQLIREIDDELERWFLLGESSTTTSGESSP